MNKEKLIHKVTIKVDPKYGDLSSRDRVKLMDDFLNPSSPKALIVDFDFSHTGRKINRRIYSKLGHIQTASDLVTPYLKPITLDHEAEAQQIIGRIIEASFNSLVDEARQYLVSRNINPTIAQELDSALLKLDFEKVRDLLKGNHLQNDKRWMGIGKVSAKAKIIDKDAIERFLDGRYQTFSAETDSDMYVCSECLQDWYAKGICECGFPGKDGFMMTGNMIGGGSSVVAHPADDLSFVTGMRFSDSKLDTDISLEDMMIVDSHQQLVIVDKEELLMNELIKKFALDAEFTQEELDTFYNGVFELEDIKQIKIIEDGKELDKPILDFKLSDEARKHLPPSVFIGTHKVFPIFDSAHAMIADALARKAVSLLKDEDCEECIVELTEEEAKEVDWAKLDEELSLEVETESKDAKLSTEARAKLSSKTFCGPDRSFPVPDCAHVTAARRLIGRASVSDGTKAKILACVSRKAKSLGCSGDAEVVNQSIVDVISRRLKAYGCDTVAQVSQSDLDTIKKEVEDILASYTIEKLKSLDKEVFVSKVLDHVSEAAKTFDVSLTDNSQTQKLTDELNSVKIKLTGLETKHTEAQKALVDVSKQKDQSEDRYKAIKIEYKELFSDHAELFKSLDTKNEVIDNLIEKLVPILKIVSPTVSVDDKNVKNIYSSLDSIDVTSLESKLNSGLTHHSVSTVENPVQKVTPEPSPNQDSISAFEKTQIEKYKRLVKEGGKEVADKWFDSKMKKYCSKDFHPSKFME